MSDVCRELFGFRGVGCPPQNSWTIITAYYGRSKSVGVCCQHLSAATVLIFPKRNTSALVEGSRRTASRVLVYSLYNPGKYGGRGVNHWENSQSSGNSTRNKVAIPAMVTAEGGGQPLGE